MGDRAGVSPHSTFPQLLVTKSRPAGKFLTAGGQVAGRCHWQLIFEHWADHRLGGVKPTPRKETVIFWANWVKILKEGIYRVMDEDKYHGHVPCHTLSRPSALCVKCETKCRATT